jgi:hypothetical protein
MDQWYSCDMALRRTYVSEQKRESAEEPNPYEREMIRQIVSIL